MVANTDQGFNSYPALPGCRLSHQSKVAEAGDMQNPRAVHIVPRAGGLWEVRKEGGTSPLQFSDLGQALDAATATNAGGAATRVIIHHPQAAA